MKRRFNGWRPEPKDLRDFMYSVSPVLATALPESVDLEPRFRTKPIDQGAIGSCGPCAAAADILFDQEQTPSRDYHPSELFIYYNARLIMGTVNEDSGVYNRDLMKAIKRYGWCQEALCPYRPEKFRQAPSREAYREAGRRKRACHYERIPQDLESMKGALAQGDPFLAGFVVYSNIVEADLTGHIPLPVDSEVWGGHDVLVVGYDDDTEEFLIRNSWGTGWGKGGYGTIAYDYLTNPEYAGDFWTLRYFE